MIAAAAAALTLAQVGSFDKPVYVTAPPGDTGDVYVVQQGGLVRSLDGSTFLDLRGAVSTSYERGLLSIAFAPDYATSHKLYAYYTATDGAVTIAEIDGVLRRTVLRVPHDQQANHNGGQLQFGPDGALYAGTGDGGSGGDPSGNGQYTTKEAPSVVTGVNHDWRLGKLLRVDRAGGDPELFAIGLRNPFRFSFDRATGDLVIADVGQDAVEEIDFAPGSDPAHPRGQGVNYGWDLWEGDQPYTGTPARTGFTFPVIDERHSDGWCSIIGGYVVRDPALPELAGQYVFGDNCKGEVWAARLSAGAASDVRALALPKVPHLSSFGEDACGRVYVASLDGPVYRLSTTGACATATTPPDTTPPRITVLNRRAQRVARTGRLTVRLRCDERCAVTATGRVTYGRTRLALRHATGSGTTVRLALKLAHSKRVRLARALRAGRTVRAGVSLRVADAAGNVATPAVTLRVRR